MVDLVLPKLPQKGGVRKSDSLSVYLTGDHFVYLNKSLSFFNQPPRWGLGRVL
jgi:hypothetical protein